MIDNPLPAQSSILTHLRDLVPDLAQEYLVIISSDLAQYEHSSAHQLSDDELLDHAIACLRRLRNDSSFPRRIARLVQAIDLLSHAQLRHLPVFSSAQERIIGVLVHSLELLPPLIHTSLIDTLRKCDSLMGSEAALDLIVSYLRALPKSGGEMSAIHSTTFSIARVIHEICSLQRFFLEEQLLSLCGAAPSGLSEQQLLSSSVSVFARVDYDVRWQLFQSISKLRDSMNRPLSFIELRNSISSGLFDALVILERANDPRAKSIYHVLAQFQNSLSLIPTQDNPHEQVRFIESRLACIVLPIISDSDYRTFSTVVTSLDKLDEKSCALVISRLEEIARKSGLPLSSAQLIVAAENGLFVAQAALHRKCSAQDPRMVSIRNGFYALESLEH